jgi:hypothetical protein
MVTNRRWSTTASVVALAVGAAGLQLSQPAAATVGASKDLVVIDLSYGSASSGWVGRFVATTAGGSVVDQGRVVERRYTNNARWQISRVLEGRRGRLTVSVRGVSLTSLRWTIVAGTKKYTGLHGHGREVDRQQGGTIVVRMSGVPLG